MSALLELGRRLPPRAVGPRERLPQRLDPRAVQAARSTGSFDEIVDFAGLEQFIDTPVKNYSSGMYVRLGFSVAINVDPDILLVDEVLAVGDEEFQRKCLERFADLRGRGQDDRGRHPRAADRAQPVRPGGLARARRGPRRRATADEVADAYLGKVQVDIQAEEDAEPDAEVEPACASPTSRCSTPGPAHRPASPRATRSRSASTTRPTSRCTNPVFSFAVHHPRGRARHRAQHQGGARPRRQGRGRGRRRAARRPPAAAARQLRHDAPSAPTRRDPQLRPAGHRALRFDVMPGVPHETFGGLVSLDGTWSLADE